ncbi:MAG: nucleotide exchange factor GrpE [Pseudomonadota bacterium]
MTSSADAENEEYDEKQASPEISPEYDQQAELSSPAEGEDPISVLTEKVAIAEQTAQENYDRFLRVSAEFENYKKRSAKEMSDFRKYANESILKDLLHVVDNLERALETGATSQSTAAICEGVALTLKDLLRLFDGLSVEAVEAMGKPFDPVVHQAVMQEPSATQPENTVIRELQKGYTLHGRLLRPAMVVVATAISDQPADQ